MTAGGVMLHIMVPVVLASVLVTLAEVTARAFARRWHRLNGKREMNQALHNLLVRGDEK